MTILFWIIAVLSLPIGLFTSFLLYLSRGLGLSHTTFGDIVCILGIPSLLVCVVCVILGILSLRKGLAKRALTFAIAGILYCGIMFAGIFIDEMVDTMLHNKRIANRDKETYGENWDAAPAIDGIPKHYQQLLNKYYAVVRDTWPADRLMELGAVSMPNYYGDTPLDNIGFALMDLDGDKIDELVIGAVAKGDRAGNEIFCIYSDPTNPFYSINSVEGSVYYLHAGDGESTYLLEIAGAESAWAIKPSTGQNFLDFDSKEGALDPAARMTVALTPFSSYK